MVEVLIRKNVGAEETLGFFISKEYYDRVIDADCDLYAWNATGVNDESNIIFKFRKNVFTKEEQYAAYAGLREAATQSQNRGLAAGPRGDHLGQDSRQNRDWVSPYQTEILNFLMDEREKLYEDKSIESIKTKYQSVVEDEETRGQVWLRSEVTKVYPEYHGWFERWLNDVIKMSKGEQVKEANYVYKTYISETNYAQSVMSGIAGYFDRYPRIPYGRETSYTEKNREKFSLCYPYLQKLNSQFRELIPGRWNAQNEQANKLDRRFLISDTVFTTLTVNHNWRTACHRDAGDLTTGFSNICGVTCPEGKGWRGGQFILPEYRIAINLQPGDMLLVNNHEGIHGNDELVGDDNDRMTIVAYFREKMLELKSWDYENLRKQYIYERHLNKDHKYYRPQWNGVSPGMWDGMITDEKLKKAVYKEADHKEWLDYMEKHNIDDPYAVATLW